MQTKQQKNKIKESCKKAFGLSRIAFFVAVSFLFVSEFSPVLPFLKGELHAQAKKRSGKQFKNSEVRIIRPRYFNKRMSFELGLNGKVTMNQSFIYTFQAGASLGFHLTESIGIELSGSYGFSADKTDKTFLQASPYEITTKIIRTKWDGFANLMWTPIYGKFQLPSGKLIYMDTFILAGAGAVGVEHRFDHCNEPTLPEGDLVKEAIINDQAIGDTYTPAFGGGIGQRIFISQNTAIRWDARFYMFNYTNNHTECSRFSLEASGNADLDTTSHSVVNIQLGVSYFL